MVPKMKQEDESVAYDHCIEELRHFGFVEASHEVLLTKADTLVANRQFNQDVEKRDPDSKLAVSKRLACLYSLKDDAVAAVDYAHLSTVLDRYCQECWVNKGNVHMMGKELLRAQHCYEEALRFDPESIEALYNYGLVTKRLAMEENESELAEKRRSAAENAFRRIHSFLPEFAEGIYHIGDLCEMGQRLVEAVEWFEVLHSLVPEDPGVLSRLGALCFASVSNALFLVNGADFYRLGDEAKAVSYYQEAHGIYPCDMDVLCWLAAFYVNNEMYEKASEYFRLSARLQPSEIKWSLMVASCYRRAGLLLKAFEEYTRIHNSHPDSVECLRFLIPLCEEMGKGQKKRELEEKLRQREKTHTAMTQNPTSISTPFQLPPNVHQDDFQHVHGTRPTPFITKPLSSSVDEWGQGALGEDLLPL